MTILLLVAFLMGCGSQQVIVDGNYPKPLIKSLPLKLALVLNSDFLEHEYHYQPKEFRESKLTIKSGISQGKMINTVTEAMFETLIILDKFPADSSNLDIDLILVPRVEQMQHAVPSQTKANIFEIWVRYHFQLFTSNGESIGDWYMSAYGKTPSKFMDSKKESINEAAHLAFRDAGANFSLNFSRIPEVKQWLHEKTNHGINP